MISQFEADIAERLKRDRFKLSATPLKAHANIYGRVERLADGVVRVSGLPTLGLNELVKFEGGQSGIVLNLERDWFDAVALDDIDNLTAGSKVFATGEVIKVPVGEGLLGRMIDPLGRPLDKKGAVLSNERQAIEKAAPAIIDRALVNKPLPTGILTIDSLFALGRGQRELIIGDRAIGKTSIAVDTIINQKDSDIICVYVAIGQRATAVERAIDSIKTHGAPERCVFVVAGAGDSTGMQWIAPFAGMTVAEYFRDLGQHVLIVLDDLSKHAATHRELSLLSNEPPGREAYPGDVFYLHARLLERAAQLSDELGGGSLTALPIAETDAGNLSAYIPTNLISITDGQIVLDSHLFAANQRPAIDVGLSVSRVGGKAQNKTLKKVAGRMRLDYAQFLELETFTRFGGVNDPRIKARVNRGQRIRAVLSQPCFATLRTVDIIAILAALDAGVLDDTAIETVDLIRAHIAKKLDTSTLTIVETIASQKPLEDDELTQLVLQVAELVHELPDIQLNGERDE